MRRDPTLESLDSSDARVRYLLRRMALMVDPESGQLELLAEKMSWHPTTISRWQRAGAVPRDKSIALYKEFGRKIGFNVEDLVGETSE